MGGSPIPESVLSWFRRLSPLVLAALLAWPAARTGAGTIEEHRADPALALRDEVADLWLRLDLGADPQAISARVDELVVELPRELLAANSASEVVRASAEALMEVRFRALARQAPLPDGFRGEFIARVGPGAMLADAVYGVPASVTVAQAILESGWGKSAPAFNLFGMKGEGPAGSTMRKVIEYRHGKRKRPTHPFRAYNSYAESMADHARALSSSERYADARAAGDDVVAYTRALRGRYATDPRYDRKLLDLRDRYDLGRLDWVEPTPALVDAAP